MEADSISTREGNKLPFIEANTKEVTMQYLKEECITPVFSKDNEVTISHSSFIETVWEAANKVFSNERIEEPAIRVSHVIKGRIPEAIHKPVNQLLESDIICIYLRTGQIGTLSYKYPYRLTYNTSVGLCCILGTASSLHSIVQQYS